MTNTWIITTGGSDVKLTSAGEKNWETWSSRIEEYVNNLRFKATRAIEEVDEPYRLPARVLGIAHQHLTEAVVQPHLTFPLFANFIGALNDREVPNHILILVSDQESIFPEVSERQKNCAYWQDTCLLYWTVRSSLLEEKY